MGVTGALDRIEQGSMVLLDGESGVVLMEPTQSELERARAQMSRRQKWGMELEAAVRQAAITPDGVALTVMGNVDLPDEIIPAVRHDAQGVGLLRTEFLVTGRAVLPTEDEQTDYFLRVSDAFPGYPVIIRSFDLGGDKFPASFRAPPEANPFLGWRSIRVCLDHPEIFRPQLRAVLRAAADRRLELMLPLVTRVEEVLDSRELLLEEALNLSREGVRAAATVPVGVMIETPAAALLADDLAKHSAFFSVGTNDLVQYTLAVDRGNARLSERFNAHHPALLRLLRAVARAGRAAKREVSVCGEMAADPVSVYLLVGLGFRTLSVASPSLPLVKWMIRQISAKDAASCAEAALELPTTDEISAFARRSVGSVVDLRLLDPSSPLPARARRASFRH